MRKKKEVSFPKVPGLVGRVSRNALFPISKVTPPISKVTPGSIYYTVKEKIIVTVLSELYIVTKMCSKHGNHCQYVAPQLWLLDCNQLEKLLYKQFFF